MARPFKTRMISCAPGVTVYKPAGIPARELGWIRLTIDEYEVLRLIDYEGLEQDAAAEAIGVSRPTISRLLGRGRRKLAQMLMDGAALLIEGGPVQLPDEFTRSGHSGRGRQGRGPGRGSGRHRGSRDS